MNCPVPSVRGIDTYWCVLLCVRTLEQASDEVLDQLTRYYRRVNPVMARRLITPVDGPPGRDLISAVHQTYPVSPEEPPPPPAEGR